MSDNKREFIRVLLPHATAAIGSQHGWLVRWALAKAGQECGWSLANVLICEANNCLGIKGGYLDRGTWIPFQGVPVIWKIATTGPERGQRVPWRVFPLGLTQCFGELVRMWNDRDPYQPFRVAAIGAFENIYTGRLPGHAEAVARNYHDVTDILYDLGAIDQKGRIK